MRIADTNITMNRYNLDTKNEKKSNFSTCLAEATSKASMDDITISNQKSKLDGTVQRVPRKDQTVSIGDAFEQLTDEQKTELKNKYDINSILPNSDEYNSLMNELYEMGVISNPSPAVPFGTIAVNFNDKGEITSHLAKVSDDKGPYLGLRNWFGDLIEQHEERYKYLSQLGMRTDEDQVFLNLFESQKNVSKVLKEIFG